MERLPGGDIVRRSQDNPIITLRELPFQCADICNAGAARFDGQYVLLITIQSLEGYYHIFRATGGDGHIFSVDPQPFLRPSHAGPFAPYEENGVLDARITFLEGWYYITYDALSTNGYCLGLARTKDFERVERLGLISQPDTKAGVLFPNKIAGRYARLERPWNGKGIWITYSKDLEFWGDSHVLLAPRGGFWDSARIGASTPPHRIDEGWLFIYYGIRDTSAGPLFRLGAAILDGDDPQQVVGRTNVPVLSPRTPYERIGDVPNLVFSCGALFDGDAVTLYYGAANSCICIGTTTVATIVQACRESEKEF
jgi:predicted GH43/DUF377 family glycosyl hydrolase